MELDETVAYTHILLKHGMQCYFTDRCSMLLELKIWANKSPVEERLWPFHHIKFVGKNFYLVIFKEVDHRTLALAAKPWVVDRNFMYIFAWDPTSDLSIGGYFPFLVWVELPYRVLSSKVGKILLAELLGRVLLYLNKDMHNSYPNDHLCVLWNMHKITLESVALRYPSGITIWQPVQFKSLPFTYFFSKNVVIYQEYVWRISRRRTWEECIRGSKN